MDLPDVDRGPRLIRAFHLISVLCKCNPPLDEADLDDSASRLADLMHGFSYFYAT